MVNAVDNPIPTDFEGKLNDLIKRMGRVERRAGISAAVVTGEGQPTYTSLPGVRDVPTEAPDASPTITVTGDSEGVTIVADGFVAPSTILDYYIDGELKEATTSRVVRWTTDAAGLPLVDEIHSFYVQAHNEVGYADPSPTVLGGINSGVSQQTVLAWVAAGFLLAGEIQVGNISIRPSRPPLGADPGDPGGIEIQLTSGGVIWFPADGSDAVITARLFAQELEVQGNMRILGEDNDLLGGLYLAASVEPPTTEPGVSTTVTDPEARTPLPGVVQTEGTFAAYTRGPTLVSGVWWVLHVGATDPVRSYDADGVELSRLSPPGVPGTVVLTDMTKLGTSWYALGSNDKVYVYNASFSTLSTSFTPDASIGDYYTIDNDGTNLVLGIVYIPTSGSNELRMAVVSTANVRAYWVKLDAALPLGRYPSGVYRGAADFGATRVIVTYYGSGIALGTYYAYSHTTTNGSTATRDATKDWPKRDTGNYDGGLFWDGTRFHGAALNKIAHFGSNTAAVTKPIGHTWVKTIGGAAETPLSPEESFVAPVRSWTRVNTGNPSDPADSVNIYIDDHKQATLGVGVTTAVYDANYDLSGAASPTDNDDFDAIAAAGFIRSKGRDFFDDYLIDIQGNGLFRGGAYRSNSDGVVEGGVGHTIEDISTADVTPTGVTNVTVPMSLDLDDVPHVDSAFLVLVAPDVQINTGGTINIIELLVDGVAEPVTINTQVATATGRLAGMKPYLITGLSPGNHTLTVRTRNTVGSTSATVRMTHSKIMAIRVM